MTAKTELSFADLFHSLLSLDDVLNVVQSVFIYFHPPELTWCNAADTEVGAADMERRVANMEHCAATLKTFYSFLTLFENFS